MVKNMLVPIDGSNFMERNINYACDLARSTGSKLTLIHVVALPTPVQAWSASAGPGFSPDVERIRKALEDAGSVILEKGKDVAGKNNVDVETILQTSYGNPAYEIIGAAERQKADLVVLGAKGHSLLRNLTVGSVCDTVVHNAPCPVLVVR